MTDRRPARRLLALALAAAAAVPLTGAVASAAPRPAAPAGAAAGDVAGDVAVAGAAAGPVAAPVALPAGWSLGEGGTTLVWTAPAALPMGGAAVEVHADGAVLGTATVGPDRRRVTVPVGAGAVRDWSSLQVVAAGRRLDAGRTSLAAAARSTQAAQAAQAAKAAQGAGRAAAQAAPDAAALPTLPALPAADDSGRPGPYRTATRSYTLPGLQVTGLPVAVEMQAVVVAPVGAPGRRPLALFLHGRHEPCYFPAGDPQEFPEQFWPCPTGWKPVPSYRGYLQSQRLLASQGWLTVSVSANGINAQDFAADDGGALARSELVRAHLARWADWSASDAAWAAAPAAVRAGPRPDLDRVFLVGHSRGGEGVNRAAVDTAVDPAARWRIGGQLLLAPTAFGRNPAPGVPTAVVLPYCDGDVFDLQGQAYLDDARDLVTNDRSLRGAVLVLGANHNFFNREWTPGVSQAPSVDDWFLADDPTCGTAAPDRLTAAQQRAVGATYVAAAAQALVLRDRGAARLLDGSAVRAASAGRAVVRSHALGAGRVPFVVPGVERALTTTGGVRARGCQVEWSPVTPAAACLSPETAFGATPHFPIDFFGVTGAPVREAVEVRWSRAAGSARVALAAPVDLRDRDQVALRVIVPPRAAATTFAVRLRDRDGTSLRAGTVTVRGLGGGTGDEQMPGKYWAQEVRVGLDRAAAAAAGLDLRRLTGLDLLPVSGRGRVWLLDAWGRDPGLARERAVPFVRVDVGTLTVEEGDSGPRQVTLPITVSGRLDRSARVWIGGVDLMGAPLPAGLPRVVTIPAGATGLAVTATVDGNTVDDEDLRGLLLFARGVRGAVAGNWVGGLRIQDDDPSPAVTITPAATAAEGAPLRWTATLAAPSNRFVGIPFAVTPPTSGTPLRTNDVPAAWIEELSGSAPPTPAVPLAEWPLFLFTAIEPGAGSATLEIPTVKDTRAEGPEVVRLEVFPADPAIGDPGVPGLPGGAVVTGTVTDR